MAVRKMAEAGHPLLKAKNKTVKNFKSLEIKRLIKDLTDTMYKTDLIGIAAPQIAENHMVFVTHPRNTGSRKLIRADKLRIYINPKLNLQVQRRKRNLRGLWKPRGHIRSCFKI